MARDSELLQAQLLQPATLITVQPTLASLGNGLFDFTHGLTPGAGEYGRLLDSAGVHGYLDLHHAGFGTVGGSAVLSGAGERGSFSLGYFDAASDGYRDNAAQRLQVSNVFTQFAISARDAVQFEARHARRSYGFPLFTFFDENNFDPDLRLGFTADTYRAGGRIGLDADALLLGSLVVKHQRDEFALPGFTSIIDEDSTLAELRYLRPLRRGAFTAGLSWLEGDESENAFFGAIANPAVPAQRIGFAGAYAYTTVPVDNQLDLHLGLAYEDHDDSRTEREQVSPKLGAEFRVSEQTRLRFAHFRAGKRRVIAGQTIEPVTFVGFPLFYSGPADINGVDTHFTGLALAHRASARLSFGTEANTRRLHLGARQIGGVEDIHMVENLASGYAYYLANDQLALSAALESEHLRGQAGTLPLAGAVSSNPYGLLRSSTLRVPLQLRWFLGSGFGALRLTHIRQHGDFLDVGLPGYRRGADSFWLTDFSLGRRLPRRSGSIAVDFRNAFATNFRHQEINPQQPMLARERTVFLRLQLEY
jgi:hypothetical protein